MFRKDIVLLLLLVVLVSTLQFADSINCPADQIARLNGTVCCKPVFNCGKDHQIAGCTGADNSADQCVKCGPGEINNHVTSSVDDSWTKFRCFRANTPAHDDCPQEDTMPFSHPRNNCALICECDNYRCYYGNPCGCIKANACGIGEELNTHTRVCEPCKTHTYKDVSGCQPCTWNETSWRLSHATGIVKEVPPVMISNVEVKVASTPLTTDGTSKYVIAAGPKEPVTSGGNEETESDKGGIPVVPIVIIILFVVIVALVLAFVLYVKRKINNGDENSRLVIFYNTLRYNRGNQPLAQVDDEEGQQEVQVNGNAVGTVKPKQAVEPMVQEKAAENVEEETPYADMSLNVSENDRNEAMVPLMSSENNRDCAQDLTETKST